MTPAELDAIEQRATDARYGPWRDLDTYTNSRADVLALAGHFREVTAERDKLARERDSYERRWRCAQESNATLANWAHAMRRAERERVEAAAAALYKAGDPWPEQFKPGQVLDARALNDFIAERVALAAPGIESAALRAAADHLLATHPGVYVDTYAGLLYNRAAALHTKRAGT